MIMVLCGAKHDMVWEYGYAEAKLLGLELRSSYPSSFATGTEMRLKMGFECFFGVKTGLKITD